MVNPNPSTFSKLSTETFTLPDVPVSPDSLDAVKVTSPAPAHPVPFTLNVQLFAITIPLATDNSLKLESTAKIAPLKSIGED